MAESIVQVTEGSGKKLHTWQRTIGANVVEDEYVIQGEQPLATYDIQPATTSIATANDHVLQIMAGASLNVRIRQITIQQTTNATTAALVTFTLVRLTTAGTGGTVITPAKRDNADAAAGCTAMTLPTAKGTEGAENRRSLIICRQAFLATAAQADPMIVWKTEPNEKPWVIPAGTTNGFAVKVLNATAGAGVLVWATVVETSFL